MIACLTHWYTSALYLVPVALLGGGGFVLDRRQKRAKRRAGQVSPPGGRQQMSDQRIRRARAHALGGTRRSGRR
ncbi:MAG TPA: hypothetical protein VH817_02415 [Thermoleophilaceae bacterium]